LGSFWKNAATLACYSGMRTRYGAPDVGDRPHTTARYG